MSVATTFFTSHPSATTFRKSVPTVYKMCESRNHPAGNLTQCSQQVPTSRKIAPSRSFRNFRM